MTRRSSLQEGSAGPRSLMDASRGAVLAAIGINPSKNVLDELNLPRQVRSYLCNSFGSDDFFVNHDDVVPEDMQAGIYKAVCRIDRQTYVLRCLKSSEIDSSRQKLLDKWEKVKSDGVQKCLKRFTNESGELVYVLEYVRRLDDVVNIASNKRGTRSSKNEIDENMLWYLVQSLSQELLDQEKKGLSCVDLQPNKVGFSIDGTVKVSNGILDVEDDGAMDNLMMPDDDDKPLGVYTPPEVVIGEEPTKESLIWRLGAVLYEAACLMPAYKIEDAENTFEAINNIVEGNREPLRSDLTPQLKSLIESCMSNDLSDRPNLQDLVGASVGAFDGVAAKLAFSQLL